MSLSVFCGYEPREAIGFHVFLHSLLRGASMDVQFQALGQVGLRAGSNAFTLSRFLVPWMMASAHEPAALFVDASDMVMLGDVADLFECFDPHFAVQVVKHPNYATRHPRKYIGTPLECANRDYDRKNWASCMLFNCHHPAWRRITYDYLHSAPILETLQLRFLQDDEIGDLPAGWNVLADEGQPTWAANLLHWTAGIPAFDHYKDAPASEHWHRLRAEMEGRA